MATPAHDERMMEIHHLIEDKVKDHIKGHPLFEPTMMIDLEYVRHMRKEKHAEYVAELIQKSQERREMFNRVKTSVIGGLVLKLLLAGGWIFYKAGEAALKHWDKAN